MTGLAGSAHDILGREPGDGAGQGLQFFQPRGHGEGQEGQEIMRVAIRPAPKNGAAGQGGAGAIAKRERVAADLGGGRVEPLGHAVQDGALGRGQEVRGGFALQLGLAPAETLRAAFAANDFEVPVEEEHEVEGGKELRGGGLSAGGGGRLRGGADGGGRCRGLGGAQFFIGEAADGAADGLEGAEFFGGELGGRRGGFGGLFLCRGLVFWRGACGRRGPGGGSRGIGFRDDQSLVAAGEDENLDGAIAGGFWPDFQLRGAGALRFAFGFIEVAGAAVAREGPRAGRSSLTVVGFGSFRGDADSGDGALECVEVALDALVLRAERRRRRACRGDRVVADAGPGADGWSRE